MEDGEAHSDEAGDLPLDWVRDKGLFEGGYASSHGDHGSGGLGAQEDETCCSVRREQGHAADFLHPLTLAQDEAVKRQTNRTTESEMI